MLIILDPRLLPEVRYGQMSDHRSRLRCAISSALPIYWLISFTLAARYTMTRPGVTLFEIGHPEYWETFDLEPMADWLALFAKFGVPAARLYGPGVADDVLIVASTETTSDDDRAALVAALKEVL